MIVTRQAVYHVIHVEGWDWIEGEFTGEGRCVRTCETLAGALELARKLDAVACDLWGPGHLVVTDADGRYVDSPSLAAERRRWLDEAVA
jgi:hypothetical protein